MFSFRCIIKQLCTKEQLNQIGCGFVSVCVHTDRQIPPHDCCMNELGTKLDHRSQPSNQQDPLPSVVERPDNAKAPDERRKERPDSFLSLNPPLQHTVPYQCCYGKSLSTHRRASKGYCIKRAEMLHCLLYFFPHSLSCLNASFPAISSWLTVLLHFNRC